MYCFNLPDGQQLRAESINQLKREVLDYFTKNLNPRQNPIDLFASLDFFNMEDKQKIETVVNDFEADRKSGSGFSAVTDLASEIDFKEDREKTRHYSEQQRRDNQSAKVVRDFRLEFGTAFHHVVEYSLDVKKADFAKRESAIDEVLDVCEKYASLLQSNPDVFNELGEELKQKHVLFFGNFDRDLFRTSIQRQITQLESQFAGKTVRCEIPLYVDSKHIKATGVVDAILYDSDGNVTLVDWKTSSDDHSSDASRRYRYYQLAMYKKILADKGIPESKIKFMNCKFKYGLEGGKAAIESFSFEDPQVILGRYAGEVDTKLLEYFPLGTVTLPKAEFDSRSQQLNGFTQHFCDTLLIQKEEVNAVKARIKECIDKQWSFYSEEYKKEIHKWVVNGDKITAKDANGNQIFSGTLDQLAEVEAKKQQENSKNQMSVLTTLLREKGPDSRQRLLDFLRTNSLKKQNQLYHALYKYMDPSWQYVYIPELESQNVITVYNPTTHYYEFIIVIPDSAMLDYSMDAKANILTHLMKDVSEIESVRQFKELPRASTGNMYKLRGLAAIAEFSDLLKRPDGEAITVSNVSVLSTVSGEHDNGSNVLDFLKVFDVMDYEAKNHADKIEYAEYIKTLSAKIKNLDFLIANKDRYTEYIKYQVKCAVRSVGMTHAEDGYISPEDITEKVDELNDVLAQLKKQYGDRVENNTDEIGILYSEIANLALHVQNIVPEDLHTMNKRSLTFQEAILAGIDLLRYGECNHFSKMGLMLCGVAQGLETSVSYASPDNVVQTANKMFSAYSAQLIKELTREAEEVNDATKEFIAEGQKNMLRSLVGNHDNLYKALLQKDANGDVSQNMYFINPYRTSELDTYQIKYLTTILWAINRHRMERLSLPTEAKKLTYAELEKHPTYFKQYKDLIDENPELLHIPLKLRAGFVGAFDGIANVVSGKITPKQWLEKTGEKLKSFIEPAILTEEQAKKQNESIEKLEYSNYYKDTKHRVTTVQKHMSNEWEINLNKLTLDFISADLKEVYFTKLLSTVDKQLAIIRLAEITTGRNLRNQEDALINRIKISIYNKSLVEEEDEDVLKLIGVAKTVGSLTKIALRPALLMKEMILGRIRNMSTVLSKNFVNDSEIKMGHLMAAAKVVMGGDLFADDSRSVRKLLGQKKLGDFSFVQQINTSYQINDRDLNVIGESLAFDRTGAHNWGTRMLYLNTIAPDNINRMILFVAKMIADGTLEAHTLNKNGQLVYDISKDSRVSYFWKNRHSNMEHDRKWVDQRSFYLNRMQQFKAEGWLNDKGGPLQTGELDANGKRQYDSFPRAYTQQEADSAKEQIGLQYAYYGHEERANVQKGWWWTMYTQFMTWLPSEIRRYFANGKTKSSIGKLEHLTDQNGKKLYWKTEKSGMQRKVAAGENGVSEQGIDQATGKALEPVQEYQYHPLEGLAVSTAKTLGQIVRRDWASLKSNPQQIRNTELFFFNLLFGALVGLLIKLLMESDTVKDSSILLSITDPMYKAARELNFVNNIASSVESFNLIGVNTVQDIISDAANTISSEGYSLFDFANSTFGLVKDLHINDIA